MATIALHSAASAMTALNTSLDVTANNLANLSTTGFKSSRVNFQDVLYMQRAQPGVENANGDQRTMGLSVGLGTRVSGTQLNFQQGGTLQTGRKLDVTIDGAGFFRVTVDASIGDGTAYTRAGNLALNSQGQLVLGSDQGRRIEPPVTIPDNATGIQIDSTGRISVTVTGTIDPQEVGQLQTAVFINPAGLSQVGENLYTQTAASGPPIVGNPGTDQRGKLQQGALEGSNVDPTEELIGMIKTQRAFEMNSNAIRTADSMLQTVSNLRRG